jgi:hypothetical protein
MTRSQIIALLAGLSSVLLVAGLAWRAYAPEAAPEKLALLDAGRPVEAPATREPQKDVEPKPPMADKSPEADKPRSVELVIQRPVGPPVDAKTAAAPPVPRPGERSTAVPPPEFDVVRVEPTGEAVIAGRGRPQSKIALMAEGKVVAEIATDGTGHFVVTPKLPPGDFELSLRDSEASLQSQQSVVVSVPRKPSDKTIVALAEIGKPTVLLVSPLQATKSEEAVSFVTAEVDKSGFYATGTAEPDARLRIYADDKMLTSVVTGSDGRWSLRATKGLGPGPHKLRADLLDKVGAVLARAEIPFEAPVDAVLAKAESVPPRDGLTATQEALLAKLANAKVQRGDSLWRISRKLLGAGLRYTQIYEANTGQIRNPRLIYPGQVLVVPPTGN